jgi:uncharacterized protein YjbJ (UPF0337 family)
MNWTTIEQGWGRYRASAKRRWDRLSEAQIAGTQGRREFLTSRVREAYALSREEAERQISDWQAAQIEAAAPR